MELMDLFTVREVAVYLKTSRQQVRKMIRSGLLPAVRIGREWRVDPHYLQDFLEYNMTG